MSKRFTRKTAVKAVERFAAAIAAGTEDLSASSISNAILSHRPKGATGAYAFKWDYLSSELLSKYCDSSGDSRSRADKAIEKMLVSDETCATINNNGFNPFPNHESVIFRARQIISDVLGDVESWASTIDAHHQFTGGATFCRTRRYGDPYFKYDCRRSLSVTPRALPYAKLLIQTTPLWRDQEIKLCRGNAVFTVPKTSEIDRAACKEPALNQVLQNSVGCYIRARLKLFGINLNDQSRNRSLARQGSISGSLATIDLKSASDSISQRCIHELLTTSWSHLLDDLRSPEGKLPSGNWITWEKHSTMGNGYTFELESLIFWALTRASIDIKQYTCNRTYYTQLANISVYGDDIICPSNHYDVVTATLTGCGFTVNEKKSFHTGPFRESCGGHYYNGHDVKPFYVRKPIDSPDRLIWLLNSLRKWAADDDGWCDPSIYQLWLKLRRKYVPSEFLGGRNLSSISEVVSPEQPRFSISWTSPTKKINGYRALLRWFQYNPEVSTLNSIRVIHRRETAVYTDRNSPYASTPVRFDQIVDVGSREKLRSKRYLPSLIETAMFPQEAVTNYNEAS